jgi:hypothetical protein
MIKSLKIIVCFFLAAGCLFVENPAAAADLTPPAKAAFCDWDCQEIPGFYIPEKGCALFIDLDIDTMIVYIDGKIYKAYEVSGGKSSTPSPVGTWLVVNVSNWGEGFGGSWIGLNVPWGQYGIHGTVKPWVIGEYNSSHGCIRMKDADVNEIKSLVSYGTVVHIKHDSLPFRVMKNGMVGSDVMTTQKMLQKLGFYTGRIDGCYGFYMENAVVKFQKAHQLKADGAVGRLTYEKICEGSRS